MSSTFTRSQAEAARLDSNAVIADPPGTPKRPPNIQAPKLLRPKGVEQAAAAHLAVLDRFDEASRRRKAAQDALTAAKAQDIRADADRVLEGKPTLSPDERAEPKAAAELAEAERELIVLTHAGTDTRDRLMAALAAEKDAWLPRLEKEHEQRMAAFEEAVADLRRAANALSEVRGAVRWLGDLEPHKVPIGSPGGRIDVRVNRVVHPVDVVLTALSEAADG